MRVLLGDDAFRQCNSIDCGRSLGQPEALSSHLLQSVLLVLQH